MTGAEWLLITITALLVPLAWRQARAFAEDSHDD